MSKLLQMQPETAINRHQIQKKIFRCPFTKEINYDTLPSMQQRETPCQHPFFGFQREDSL